MDDKQFGIAMISLVAAALTHSADVTNTFLPPDEAVRRARKIVETARDEYIEWDNAENLKHRTARR